MYIKQITIQGFRSYRDQTKIEPFSPGHNVIVGRNGSGKSNFFYAIQFVLSDEFSNLRQEQRQSLLHEGTGPRVISAFVEIIFDNSDNRVPIEKDEVQLQRVIGAKKDQYFLDGKGVTKGDVMNLLESAGFSRSNPYYIVKQGKINELATAQDLYRLKLLREVAGTRVYDERKAESKKILNETESKREKIDDLLKYIEDRLTTLEEETNELREYQKLDKMKRSLEYTIYDHELKDTRKKLDELAERRENSSHRSNELHESLQKAADQMTSSTKKLRELKQQFSGYEDEHKQLTQEQTARFEQKTNLELDIDDVRKKLEEERSGKRKNEDSLVKINGLIREKQERLEELLPRYDAISAEENAVNQEMVLAEQRKKELFAKLGRKANFSTKDARDKYITKELKSLQRQIKDREDQITNLRNDLAMDQERTHELEKNFTDINSEMEVQREAVEQNNRSVATLKQQRDQLHGERQEYWRQENNLAQELSNMRDELNHIEQQLQSLIGRGNKQGMDSVNRIIEGFRTKERRSNAESEVVNGYHGVLIQNFSTAPQFYTAVEVTAGNRLFYHLVDTDRIGTKILAEMNRNRLPGEVNFIPLNRIEARDVDYPQIKDAIPMLEHLEYEDRFKKAVKHVFGRTLVCRNMETATSLARQQGLDCITLEGDQVSCKGALTGGYYDTRRSRLELESNKKRCREEVLAKEAALQAHKATLADVEGRINQAISELQKVESKDNKLRDAFERCKQERLNIKQEQQDLQSRKHPKERQLNDLQSSLAQFRAHETGLQAELGTDLLSQLEPAEQAEAESLSEKIASLQEKSKTLFKERTQLEGEKNKLDNLLKTNLLRRRDELQGKLHEISVEELTTQVDTYYGELQRTNDRLKELSKRIVELDAELEQFHEKQKKYEASLEQAQNDEREVQARITDDAKEMDKMANKQHMLLKKKEECMKKIRELGSLPSDAFDKYQNLSLKQLFKKLENCNHDLKKYGNVNKKALDQFVSFSEQKEKLHKRREELEKGYQSITELMNVLEQRKFEAIQLTFKQVSKYFSDVFTRLVPQGSACLVMKKGELDSADKDGPVPLVEQFTGVGIKVSFGGTAETREMQQLSGGQKSLVALAMIFAIQRCDPAPFYLFDEIDAALDSQHRKAVAEMIHDLSKEAQFITTTFRPELLERADKFYGVRFRNKVSHVDCVSREDAQDFVEDDATHA